MSLNVEYPLWEKTASIIIGVLFFGGTVPVLAKMIGFQFLPSEQYYQDYDSVASWLGFIVGILLFYLVLFRKFFEKINRKSTEELALGWFTRRFVVIGAPVLVAMFTHLFVVATIPLIAAVFTGHTTSLDYTADKMSRLAQCSQHVTLKNMPMLLREVCGVNDEFREKLRPEMQIKIDGWGTGWGLFPKHLHIEN